jgi:hypothetical protein
VVWDRAEGAVSRVPVSGDRAVARRAEAAREAEGLEDPEGREGQGGRGDRHGREDRDGPGSTGHGAGLGPTACYVMSCPKCGLTMVKEGAKPPSGDEQGPNIIP